MTRVAAIIAREMREAMPAFILFFVAFHMIEVTKSVILDDHRITTTGTAIATVSALVVAKAVLLVEKLPVPRLFSGRAIYTILWKTLLFAAVATLFRALEETIRALVREGTSVADPSAPVTTVSWPDFLVMQMWLLALLFLYCVTATLARTIGGESLRRILLERQERRDDGE